MKRWPTKPLEELGDLRGGGTPSRKVPQYFQGDIPWITGADVTDLYVSKAREFITSEAVENSATTLLPKNTVLVVSRTGVGKVGIAATPLCTSQDLTGIICGKFVRPEYLARCLLARADSLTNAAQGATIRGITRQFLSRVEIPVPPLAEQERIVKLLDEADELRKLRAQADRRTAALISALFHEMFGDPIANSKGLLTAPLGELASVERGKFTPRPRNDPSYFGGEYPFIQTGDITNSDGFVTQHSQTLNEKGKSVSKEFPAGAIVIAIVGATIGQTAILGIPVFATDSVVAIQPHRDRAVTEYVHNVLKFWRPVFLAQAPETARANLNVATLKAVEILVPPLAQQKEFAARVTEIRAVQAEQAASRLRLENLFQSMLHRAFNGEL